MKDKLQKLATAGKLEVKLAGPDSETATKSFSGYGAVFNNVDQASDIIEPGAFAKTLADHKAAGTAPSMFFNHDMWSMPIGVWTALEEDEIGLKATGELIDSVSGRDAYAAVKAGAVTGLSIGYIVTDFTIENGVRTIHEAKLIEISVVTFPCNLSARVSDVKSAMSDEEFVAKLIDLGVDEDDAEALKAKRNKAADEEAVDESSDEDADAEDAPADDAEDAPADDTDEPSEDNKEDDETKYNKAVMDAVNNLIRELKQENHGR